MNTITTEVTRRRGRLCLVRHGETDWNRNNVFTGWEDPSLSSIGRTSSIRAGEMLLDIGFRPDTIQTSVLMRSVETATVMAGVLGASTSLIERHWRLNERHYGAWQGRLKADLSRTTGPEFVQSIRRGFDTRPPPLALRLQANLLNDERYAALDRRALPNAESLSDVVYRVRPFLMEVLLPRIRSRDEVLVVAHGNTMRALVMQLERATPEAIGQLEFPAGIPLVYDVAGDANLINRRFLGDETANRLAAEAVRNEIFGAGPPTQ